MSSTKTRARTRFCAGCQVGQGARCKCRREIPVPLLQVLMYGASVALVVGLGVWAWRAWA